jgi:lysozyme
LATDLQQVDDAVTKLKKRLLSDQQLAALISFAFNLGADALAGSTLLQKVNDCDFIGAAHEFPKWDHAGGTELRGLLIRRFEEAALFLKGS